VTVLGIDCPPVVGSSASVPASVAARVSLRIPPGTDPHAALAALTAHLQKAAPWGARVDIKPEQSGAPFRAATDGPAYAALDAAARAVYGKPLSYVGQGGSIPLCNVLQESFPDAEIVLMGVEEPRCAIHAPNESVDPEELRHMAEVEARFLVEYARRPH
jgi:acetylornithine deacetylase/succinyl-diaminopimelate desuccinylase-like protein